MTKPIVLIVLDGWGIAPEGPGNAISLANLPNFRRLWTLFPHGKLQASSEAVGLPHGESGNTETGHLNLGAGHIVYQDLPRINMAIADGSFYQNKAFLGAIEHAKKNKSHLHLMGLVGAGGVHANNEHLFALLHLAKEQHFQRIFLHLFTDGRDSPPTSALEYIKTVEEELNFIGFGKIASLMGRYYAMDRDRRWERTEKAYLALTQGICATNHSAEEIVRRSYERSITDEFIEPTAICNNGEPIGLIKEGDTVIFYNFRIDRPRQLTKAFVLENFAEEAKKTGFDPYAVRYEKKHLVEEEETQPFLRGEKIKNLFFVTMTQYEKGLPVHVTFPPQLVKYPLGRVISDRGLRQLRLTESEKERFVTFYFNGQRETPLPGEDRLIIPSLKVPTYDLAPQMRAREITNSFLEKLNQEVYDFILINFANPDMVGHTGFIPAAVKACEVIDECLGKIAFQILQKRGALIISADHGNAEEMINQKTGGVDTEHSTSLVPLIIVSQEFEGKPKELRLGILADLAPTVLGLMGIPKPGEMTGRNLLI